MMVKKAQQNIILEMVAESLIALLSWIIPMNMASMIFSILTDTRIDSDQLFWITMIASPIYGIYKVILEYKHGVRK